MISTQSIESAAAHGSSAWVKNFIREYFSRLLSGNISSEDFAQAIDSEFAHRNLTTIKQQKNPRSNIVQALKSIDPNHTAIPLVALTAEQYSILSDEQQGITAERETQFIYPANVELAVAKAIDLLTSDDYADIAAGLAILIGRRIGEILLSDFVPNSEWTIDFGNMFKKKPADSFILEIPTLAPATLVLAAIAKLQYIIDVEDIKRNDSISPKLAKQEVNKRYSAKVVTKCAAIYAGLIPPRTGKDNLYTHIFRAVYATIATHWYCPPKVPEHRYKAQIQGHVEYKDGKFHPKYNSRSNYDDYAIGDGNGNRDGRLGIKLGLVPNLRVLKEFINFTDETKMTPETENLTPLQIANRNRSNDAKARIEKAYQQILPLLTPETTLTQRRKMMREISGAGLGDGTLNKHKEIWHPEHNDETLDDRPPASISDLTIDAGEVLAELQSVNANAEDADRLKYHRPAIEFRPQQEPKSIQDSSGFLKGILEQPLVRTDPNIAWFISELEKVKAENKNLRYDNEVLQIAIAQLEQQKTMLATIPPSSPTYEELLAQNDRLNQELSDTKLRLDSIANMLGGEIAKPIIPPSPKQAQSIATPVNIPFPVTAEEPHRIPIPTAHKKVVTWTPETESSINRAIDAILAWNQNTTTDRLRASIPILHSLCRAMGAANRTAISHVLNARAEELNTHYLSYKIGERDNRFVDVATILPLVARNYLELENWEDVEAPKK